MSTEDVCTLLSSTKPFGVLLGRLPSNFLAKEGSYNDLYLTARKPRYKKTKQFACGHGKASAENWELKVKIPILDKASKPLLA